MFQSMFKSWLSNESKHSTSANHSQDLTPRYFSKYYFEFRKERLYLSDRTERKGFFCVKFGSIQKKFGFENHEHLARKWYFLANIFSSKNTDNIN